MSGQLLFTLTDPAWVAKPRMTCMLCGDWVQGRSQADWHARKHGKKVRLATLEKVPVEQRYEIVPPLSVLAHDAKTSETSER